MKCAKERTTKDGVPINGYALAWDEVCGIQNVGEARLQSNDLADALKNWHLKNQSIVLWTVNGLDKSFSDGWRKHFRIYLPGEGEVFIQDLAALSLEHTILLLKKVAYEYQVYIGKSPTGETNIDAEVLEAFLGAFGRSCWCNSFGRK